MTVGEVAPLLDAVEIRHRSPRATAVCTGVQVTGVVNAYQDDIRVSDAA
jgi:hypothetical protein